MFRQIIKKSPKLKDHYRAHYNPSIVPALVQINTVRILLFCFTKINVNIITTYRPGSSKWTLTLHVSPRTKCIHFSCLSCVPHAHQQYPYCCSNSIFERPSNRTFVINQFNTMLFHLRDVIFICIENFCLSVVSGIWQFIKMYKGRGRYSNHQYITL